MNQTPSGTPRARRAERKQLSATVQFRRGTRRANVRVLDINELGVRVAGVYLMHEGEKFWLTLPGLEPIEASVAWTTDFEMGCEFTRPLHPAVFQLLLQRL